MLLRLSQSGMAKTVSRAAQAELALVRETLSLLDQGSEPKASVFATPFMKQVERRLQWFLTDGEGERLVRGRAALEARYHRIDSKSGEATFAELTDFHRFRFLQLLTDAQQEKVATWTKDLIFEKPLDSTAKDREDDQEGNDGALALFA